jgi:ribosomal protein S18 acetylase RimI-like enzyme
MSVRLLEPADIPAAVDVLTSAFSGDPLLVWSCGARERAGMRASSTMTTTLWTRARSAYGYFENGELIAVALYQRPGQKVTALRALRAGLWRMPLGAGLVGTQRIFRTFAFADRFKTSVLNGEPHLYLDTLGVHRSAARRGIGPRLLLESLADLRRQSHAPCFLLTHLRENVTLYDRLGFEALGECAVPKSPITFWGMRQAP